MSTNARQSGAQRPGAQRPNLLLPDAEPWPDDPSKPVIVLEDVWKAFGDVQVLKGLDLTVLPRRTTVVAGQSGSGKSLILKLMMGLERPDRGRVLLFGQDVATLSELQLTALRKRMTMVFQSYALFDSLTVDENIGFALSENTSLAATEIARRVTEQLSRFGLSDAGQMLPSDLSGGMKKRVSLARSLVSNPEVMLVDEPTTGLDPVMTLRVTEMLLDIRREYGITSVVVSHDMGSATRLADRLAVIADGRVAAYGTPEEVRQSEHPTVRGFFDNSATASLIETAAERKEEPAEPDTEPIIELLDIHRAFGDHEVLRGVDLRVAPKKITVIIGGSGSGKSVIIKHIMGLLAPDRGQVLLFGEDVTGFRERRLEPYRARIGMLFQNAALLDSLTVADNVAFPLVERLGVSPKEARERTMDVLEKVHIPEAADRFPAEISNGQRKRAGLARAIVTGPEVIIYDEPTTGQDPIMTRYVDDMIVEAQETFDVTSVVISHDMASTFRIGHEIAMLHEGRIIISGSPSDVVTSEDPRVRAFIFAGQRQPDAS